MNTNDAPNMEISQWLFWANALPLTVIIITLCLVWARELENFWKGFSNLCRRNKGRVGQGRQYAMVNGRPDAYSMMAPRAELRMRREWDIDDDDDDEHDIRIHRNRSSTQPIIYSEHRRAARPFYYITSRHYEH
jgi:hypothetical protein